MQKAPLFELDPEIERTFRSRRKKQRQETTRKKQEENSKQEAKMADETPMTFGQYVTPNVTNPKSAINAPRVAANDFELKQSLINLVRATPFHGLPNEDPNRHLRIFRQACDTFKANGASEDAIKLRLFPFSLEGKAWEWLDSLPVNSITTFDQLASTFLAKYFPPSKLTSLRNQISTFAQEPDETFYDAWERFKDLLRQCPQHGFEPWVPIQAFYNGVDDNLRANILSATGGNIMGKTVDELYALIEQMALNSYQWSKPRSKRTGGKLEVDVVSVLSAKIDAMT